VAALLPAPNGNKSSKQMQYPDFTLRRSRHLAGAGVEFQIGDMSGRSKKRVMCSLKVIGESEGVNQQAQEEYARIFF
jgi:hypothetical protein